MAIVISLVLLCACINSAAQLLFKEGMNRVGNFDFAWANIFPIAAKIMLSPFIITGIMLYVLSITLWLLVLSRVDASVAYPMASLGYIITAVSAYFILNEQLSMMQIIGIVVIMIGVYLIAQH